MHLAWTCHTSSIPLAGNGAFGNATGNPFNTTNLTTAANFYQYISATNTQGLYATDYINMYNLLNNKTKNSYVDYYFCCLDVRTFSDEQFPYCHLLFG